MHSQATPKPSSNNRWQNILGLTLGGSIVFCFLYNFGTIIYFHTSSTFANIPKGSILDFWISIVFFLALTGYSLLTKAFQSQKSLDLHNALFFGASTIACFVLFRSQDFWPALLGGKASVEALFANFPNGAVFPYSTLYFMIHFGLCIYQLKNRGTDLHDLMPFVLNIFKTGLFFTLFMTNNVKLFLVLAFNFSACTALTKINAVLYDSLDGGVRNIIKMIFWVLEVVVFAALNIVGFGIVLVKFWTTHQFSDSWILKFDMIVLGLILVGIWGLSLVVFGSTVYKTKINFEVKKMNDEKKELLAQAKQQ